MIRIVAIHPLDDTHADTADYEVTLVHRGREVKLVFHVSRNVVGGHRLSVYETPLEAHLEFDEYELTRRVPPGRPRGGPDNPVIDEIRRMVTAFDQGKQVRLPATITVTELMLKRLWRRLKCEWRFYWESLKHRLFRN